MTKRFSKFSAHGLLAFMLIATLVAMFGVLTVGCSPEQIDAYKHQYEQAKEYRAATTQAVDTLQAEIALLPPNDPVRRAAESKLQKTQELLAKLDVYLPKVEAAIAAAQSGNITDPAIRDLAGSVPYGGLIFSLASLGFGFYQRVKRQQASNALSQVVKGVDEVLPQKTDEQKLKLASVQDDSTKSLVAAIKAK